MVFNEILIPQDPFTETNVTRKMSVVEKFAFYSKNQSYIFFISVFFGESTYALISITY